MLFLNLNNEEGYSLSELLIAIVISTVLVAAAGATYISQNRSFVTQESVSEVNTQSKIAHDLIANNIRSAGFGVPEDMNVDPINAQNTIVNPVDSDASPDAVTIVGGFRRIGALWPVGVNPGDACPDNVPLGSTVVRIIYSGTLRPNDSDRQNLSIDGVQFVRVSSCTLDGLDCDNSPITLDRPLSQSFPLLDDNADNFCDTGRPVYLVEDTTFCVDGNSSLRRIRRQADTNNCTGLGTSDDEEIAENIEDLQIAYAVDVNRDGLIDDTNGSGDVDAGDFTNGAAVADISTISAIRLNVLAMADRPDPDFEGLGNPPDFVENRDHDETATDSLRRRWWQSIISMRGQ